MTSTLSRWEKDALRAAAEILAGHSKSAKDARTPGELAQMLDPKTVQTPALDLIDEALVDAAEGRCDRLMVALPPQEGKLLSHSTPVPTPDGWIRHGDLKPGSIVFHPSGRRINVTDVHEPAIATMRIWFSDHTSVLAHPKHEWTIWDELGHTWATWETRRIAEAMDCGPLTLPPRGPLQGTYANLPTAKAGRGERCAIVAVTEDAPEPGHCITVDVEDGLYLVGAGMVPTHNSVRVSRRFPEFLLARNPNLRIAIISYAHGVARRIARSIRDDINLHSAHLGISVSTTSSAANEWSIAGHDGEVYATGIAGSLTSRPVDCLRGDSQIMTEYGYAPIRQLCESGDAYPRVLSFNHATGKTEWRSIVATRAIPNRPLVEIVTSSGRRITCTPDHRVHVPGRGYVRANQLRPGDALLAIRASADQVPHLLDSGRAIPVAPQRTQRGDTALLLEEVPVRHGDDRADMRGLRNRVYETPLRGREGQAQGLHPLVLHSDMLPRNVKQERARAGNDTDPGTADRPGHQRQAGAYRVGPTSVLHGGSRRTDGWGQPEASVPPVRDDSQEQKCDVQAVLPVRPCIDLPDLDVHAVLVAVREDAGGARVAGAGRADERVLPVRVSSPVDAGAPVGSVRALRKAVQGRQREAVLLGRLPAGGPRRAPRVKESALPAVRRRLYPEGLAAAVLRPDLRRPGALGAHDRHGQLALQGRHELRRVVPADAPVDPGTRRQSVPGLFSHRPAGADRTQRPLPVEVPPRGPSPQRGPGGQPARESDPDLFAVPHAAPQVGYDTVSVVRDLCGERDTVYDIQVDGNSNFFADEVLVHNCLIIDDPYKNGEQADSEAWQEVVRDFWTEVAVPRLGPGAIVIIVQTRWRDDDLSGWLQVEDDAGRWRVINIPARADHDPNKGEVDLLGRQPGEYLESARGRTVEQWEQRQAEVGSRTWNALFQGRPAPASGNIFKAEWFPFYEAPQWVVREDGSYWAIGFDELIASWDMTFKDTDGTDYVCGQVWGRRGIDVFLLDQVHDRMSFVETCNAVRLLAAKWPQALLKLVEDKANGPAVLSALGRKVPGLVPEQPEGSKVARAAAISPFAESGSIFLPAPELAPWVDGLIEELKTFPRARHDDRTDTLTQAVRRLLLNPLLTDDTVYEDEDQYEATGSISMY